MAQVSRYVFQLSTPYVLGVQSMINHNMCMREFAEKLAKLRDGLGLTQTQLAANCGYSGQSRIGNYEAGIRTPRLEEIPVLAAQLGCAPVDLLPDSWHAVVSPTRLAESAKTTALMLRALAETTPGGERLSQLADELDTQVSVIQPPQPELRRITGPRRRRK